MDYYQRKYCEECGKYFYYVDAVAPNEAEPCPINGAHTTRDCVVRYAF